MQHPTWLLPINLYTWKVRAPENQSWQAYPGYSGDITFISGWIPSSDGEEPGQPKFANWPPHIHLPKEVME